MKSSAKILIGVGAVAAVAMAYHFYKQKQKDKEVAGAKSATDASADTQTSDKANPDNTILPGGEPGGMAIKPVHSEEISIMAPAGLDIPVPSGYIKRPVFLVDPETGGYRNDAPMMEYTTVNMQTV